MAPPPTDDGSQIVLQLTRRSVVQHGVGFVAVEPIPSETGASETNLHDVEQEKADVDEARLIRWRWSCVG